MKVHYKKALCGYSGTSDDAVYYYHPGIQLSLVRDYVIPKESSANRRMKAVMQNLQQLQPSEGYKQNFKDYLIRYNRLKVNQDSPVLAWNNLFLKLMYAMEKATAGIDLATLSRQQIIDLDLPCQSVCRAVEAGLLPSVDGYQGLTALI
jgi:hypothetical protein